MGAKPSLTVVIPADSDQISQAQKAAACVTRANDGRVFANVAAHIITAEPGTAYLNQGCELAEKDGADWLCYLQSDEELHPNAFEMISPALQKYDAVWGGFELIGETKNSKAAKLVSYTGSSFLDLCHMTLHWWIGRSHFVRVPAARDVILGRNANHATYGAYLIEMWRRYSCLKTAQPLTGGPSVPLVSDDDQQTILNDLHQTAQFIEFSHAGHNIKLAYSGRNPTLERLQLRGLFFEGKELDELAKHIPPGSTILDIGANTGNHMVYFAKVMAAAKVIIFEPNPDAVAILLKVIAVNGLKSVDPSYLGKGVGARKQASTLQTGRRGHLGTAQLVDAPGGEIAVVPLDDCAIETVDLIKIDVENMELDVLRGARQLIAHNEPVLFVEVMDANIAKFLSLIDEMDYRIEDIYPDQGYANYIVVPKHGGILD